MNERGPARPGNEGRFLVSNRQKNTHRRPMRPVTPATQASRGLAGVAIAATFVLSGSTIATAETNPQADAADAQSTTVIVPEVIPAVEIPVVESGATTAFGAVAVVEPTALKATPPVVKPAVKDTKKTETADARNNQSTENARGEQRAQDASSQRNTNGGQSAERQDQQNAAQGEQGDESSENNSSNSSQQQGEEQQNESTSARSVVAGSSILETARNGIGVQYVWGGSSPSGWDCSGFVQWVFKQHGINLPRTASAQVAVATQIPASQARPGDLVYKPGHIGIYAGNGRFVDAGNSRVDTSERNIYSGNWSYYRVTG